MKFLYPFLLFFLISCGKNNVRKATVPSPFLHQEMKTEDQSEVGLSVQLKEIESVQIKFLGQKLYQKINQNIPFDSDLYFKKKWVYLAKLENEQDDQQFDFPIDETDREMNIFRIHSLNEASLFASFPYQQFDEVEIGLTIRLDYQTAQKVSLRNIQVKLFSLDHEFKRYELSEAPLLKYNSENEDIELEKGKSSPNYHYQLKFRISPLDMYKILKGDRWPGLFLSNMEVEKKGKIKDYRDILKREFKKPKIWVHNQNITQFSAKNSVSEVMKKLDSEVEYRNDGRVMYFFKKRTGERGEWRVLKNGDFSYVTYITQNELNSFDINPIYIENLDQKSGQVIVETQGHLIETKVHQTQEQLTAEVDKPRICSRWTRHDLKGECEQVDLRCFTTLKRIETHVRKLPFESKLLQDVSEFKTPKNQLRTLTVGIVGFGHCPARQHAGFKIPNYPQHSWTAEVGTKYELDVVFKRPATFQLWL